MYAALLSFWGPTHFDANYPIVAEISQSGPKGMN